MAPQEVPSQDVQRPEGVQPEGVQVREVPAAGRFEAHVDGRLAGFVTYLRGPGVVTFEHTEVDPDFEGQGVGSALARAALDQARADGTEVVPACPFVAGWIERHPGYADLVRVGG
jgi:predicted GNAT family acetyltransferase